MRCYVYKGDKKEGMYLYLPQHADPQLIAELPAALTELLGELSLVVDFDLTEIKLVKADAGQVMEDMRDKGFYLQMPTNDMWLEEHQYFN